MARSFRDKKPTPKAARTPLKHADDELDKTARALIQTDLKLRETNDRFNQQIIQLHALQRLAGCINSTFDIEEILKIVSVSLVKDLEFEKTGIVFLERTGLKPMQSAYAGFSAPEYGHLLEHFSSVLKPALMQVEDVYLETAAYAVPPWSKLLQSLSLASLVLLPMRYQSKLIGFIIAGHRHTTTRLTDPQRRFYAMYASQTASAIENARLYEALGQSNLTLEEKVQERTRNLIDANERLRELDTAKSNFISLISHELRTPLTSIKGLATMLFHHDKEISDEKRKIYLHVLNEETDRLTRLITELLDIARIESGRMEFSWSAVSIPAMLDRIYEKLKLQTKGIGLVSQFPSDFSDVVGDADKLEQVFLNLITNALRFSPPSGTITVTGRRERDGVVLEFIDQGMGINFSEQEKIFDKFYRLDNDVNRRNPGTGLGLSICRALINLHGGKIWVESDPGQGSRFLISLPRNLDKMPNSNIGRANDLTAPPPAQRFAGGF